MKKYDFCLLALYVCLVAVFFIVVWRYESRNIRERKEGMRYFEEIYRTPIKTVVFRNTDAVVMVYGAGKNCLENGLEFSGSFDVRYADCLKISGDTLVFSEKPGEVKKSEYPNIYNLKLHIADHIRVEIINAPHVKIERQGGGQNRNQDGI